MRHPLEAIDCQLTQLLGHVVHSDYSLEFLRAVRSEFLSCYLALENEIKSREPVSLPVETKPDQRSRGLLGLITTPRNGGDAA